MNTVSIVENYQIFEKNGKFGLSYTHPTSSHIKGVPDWAAEDELILEPVHDAIEIINRDADVDELLASKSESIENHGISYIENNCMVVGADGKYGLLYRGEVVSGLDYDAVIKLTYRHYLCRKGQTVTVYRYNDIGYESAKNDGPFIEMAELQIEAPLGLKTFLDALEHHHPDVHKDILGLMVTYGNLGSYVTEYRHISCFVEGVSFNGAVQTMIIDDGFNTVSHKMKYSPILEP